MSEKNTASSDHDFHGSVVDVGPKYGLERWLAMQGQLLATAASSEQREYANAEFERRQRTRIRQLRMVFVPTAAGIPAALAIFAAAGTTTPPPWGIWVYLIWVGMFLMARVDDYIRSLDRARHVGRRSFVAREHVSLYVVIPLLLLLIVNSGWSSAMLTTVVVIHLCWYFPRWTQDYRA